MTAEEQAQVAAFIAAGKVTKCATVSAQDATVEGFLARYREERGGKRMRIMRPWRQKGKNPGTRAKTP
jgi:hypothetical protein